MLEIADYFGIYFYIGSQSSPNVLIEKYGCTAPFNEIWRISVHSISITCEFLLMRMHHTNCKKKKSKEEIISTVLFGCRNTFIYIWYGFFWVSYFYCCRLLPFFQRAKCEMRTRKYERELHAEIRSRHNSSQFSIFSHR